MALDEHYNVIHQEGSTGDIERNRKKKNAKNEKEIIKMATLARQNNLTYGAYVAQQQYLSQTHIVRSW